MQLVDLRSPVAISFVLIVEAGWHGSRGERPRFPGGSFPAALEAAELFLPKGTVAAQVLTWLANVLLVST